jgi:hypothetical protein
MVNCTHTNDSILCLVCSLLNTMYSEKTIERYKIPWVTRVLMGILRTRIKGTSLAIQPISGENVRPEDTVFILLGETTLDCIRKFLDDSNDIQTINNLIQNLRVLYND